jgi:hypothetical protein
VAVHVVPTVLKAVTVKLAVSEGTSVAILSVAVTVPEVQVRAIVTAVPLLSEKSFATLNVAVLAVLVIVQDDVLPWLIATVAQAA